MSGNRLYIPGCDNAKTPKYDSGPLSLLNPFRATCGYHDSRMFKERAKIAAFHGACVGIFPAACFHAIMNGYATSSFTLIHGKERFLMTSGIFSSIGAASGLSYMGGVKLASYVRGDKDDWANHLFGGYCLTLPAAMYKMAPRIFFFGGTYAGVILMVAKMIFQGEHKLVNWEASPTRVTESIYPEIYIRSVLPPLPKEEERRKAFEYQSKDF